MLVQSSLPLCLPCLSHSLSVWPWALEHALALARALLLSLSPSLAATLAPLPPSRSVCLCVCWHCFYEGGQWPPLSTLTKTVSQEHGAFQTRVFAHWAGGAGRRAGRGRRACLLHRPRDDAILGNNGADGDRRSAKPGVVLARPRENCELEAANRLFASLLLNWILWRGG